MTGGRKKGHIVTEETKRMISDSLKSRHISPETEFTSKEMKGKNNPMYDVPSPFKGKHHTNETKKKMSESLKGRKPTKGSFKKGHTCPQEWRDKISDKTNKGKSPIHKLLFRRLYKVWRIQILERDNYTCQKCDSSKNLEVHHDRETVAEIISKFSDSSLTNKEIADKIVEYHIKNNISGITLCRKCHRICHKTHSMSPGG